MGGEGADVKFAQLPLTPQDAVAEAAIALEAAQIRFAHVAIVHQRTNQLYGGHLRVMQRITRSRCSLEGILRTGPWLRIQYFREVGIPHDAGPLRRGSPFSVANIRASTVGNEKRGNSLIGIHRCIKGTGRHLQIEWRSATCESINVCTMIDEQANDVVRSAPGSAVQRRNTALTAKARIGPVLKEQGRDAEACVRCSSVQRPFARFRRNAEIRVGPGAKQR